MSNFLTAKTAAAQLCVSEDSVLRLIKAGQLRASNVGAGVKRSRWIIDERDLAAFIAGRANLAARKMATAPRRRQIPDVPNYI